MKNYYSELEYIYDAICLLKRVSYQRYLRKREENLIEEQAKKEGEFVVELHHNLTELYTLIVFDEEKYGTTCKMD